MTLVILVWAHRDWRFLDGKYLSTGVDLNKLPAVRFMNVLDHEFVEQQIVTSEEDEARSTARARLLAGYNNNADLDGEANDTLATPPLEDGNPFGGGITPQTDAGFMGLEPPLG